MFILGWLYNKYSLTLPAWSRDKHNKNTPWTHRLLNTGFKSWVQSLSLLFSKARLKMLARAGPNRGSKGTPSICLWNLLLNIKNDSLLAALSKLQKNYRYRNYQHAMVLLK